MCDGINNRSFLPVDRTDTSLVAFTKKLKYSAVVCKCPLFCSSHLISGTKQFNSIILLQLAEQKTVQNDKNKRTERRCVVSNIIPELYNIDCSRSVINNDFEL
jgi:hypothetical protein